MKNANEIYKQADQMTEDNYNMLFDSLNNEDKNTVSSLIRLGDSKELALSTVVNLERNNDNSFYYNAYCL